LFSFFFFLNSVLSLTRFLFYPKPPLSVGLLFPFLQHGPVDAGSLGDVRSSYAQLVILSSPFKLFFSDLSSVPLHCDRLFDSAGMAPRD
jgi:hypothetical protein